MSINLFSFCPDSIRTNLNVGSAAMFQLTIERTSSHMLFGYEVLGLISNLAKSP